MHINGMNGISYKAIVTVSSPQMVTAGQLQLPSMIFL